MRGRGYLAFLVGIGLTAGTCYCVMQEQQLQVKAGFQRDVENVTRDTRTRMQIYFDTLHGMKGMYAVNDRIDRLQFHRYVSELKVDRRYPGFQALQFVRVVAEDELPAFVARVRRDTTLDAAGYPGFHVHPATRRAPHYIIEYTEPLKGNENAFGLDLAALPAHLKALEVGRDSGEIVATERITLVQDASGEPGFIARAPVFRNDLPLDTTAQRRAALAGFVAIVFKVNALMREVIDPALLEHLHVRIEDGGLRNGKPPAPGVDTLLYDSDVQVETHRQKAQAAPGLASQVLLPVGQRNWIIQFEGRAGARYNRSPLPLLLVGAAGVIISALIAALLVRNRQPSPAPLAGGR